MNSKLLRRLAITLVVPLMAFAAACGSSDDDDASGAGKGGPVKVVGQNFTESIIVANLYKDLLDNAGFDASVQSLATRDLYLKDLEAATTYQVAAEYLSSSAEALNVQDKGENAPEIGSSDSAATLAKLTPLAEKYGLTPLKYASAQSTNGYAVTQEFAQKNSLTTLSDLAALGQPIKLAAAIDCKARPGCGKGLKDVYKLNITKYLTTGFGGPKNVAALKSGEVQLAQFGSTDPTVGKNGFVLLKDDKGFLNAENILPVVNTTWLKAHPQAKAALESLASVLTSEDLTALIGKVDIGREKASDVAEAYLKDKGLLK